MQALVDTDGYLLHADEGFARLLQAQLPDWDGIRLPPAWLQAPDRQSAHSAPLVTACETVGEQRLVSIRLRTAVDELTARERRVAELFAGGATYREIAEQLHRSPSTIRNHLQSIYLKLGISTKAELVAKMQH